LAQLLQLHSNAAIDEAITDLDGGAANQTLVEVVLEPHPTIQATGELLFVTLLLSVVQWNRGRQGDVGDAFRLVGHAIELSADLSHIARPATLDQETQ
jgi:hypothetical protein